MSAAAPATLSRLVVRRVALFALLAMTLQSVWMLWRYVGDPDHIADHLVDSEVEALAGGVSVVDGVVRVIPPRKVGNRYSGPGSGYVARLRAKDGAVLWRSCDQRCEAKAFAPDAPPAQSWTRQRAPGFPLQIMGGHEIETKAGPLYLEVAIDRDPDAVVRSIALSELAEEMLLPTAVALVLALAASLFAIRRALAPVEAAAERAAKLDPLRPETRLESDGMPLEVARLVGAVNLSYARVRELTAGQKVFTAAISHEIRTPLAAMRLELEGVDHPRVRRALRELDDLVAFVEQLTSLARIEAADCATVGQVELGPALSDMVAAVAPWVYDQGATIEMLADGGATVEGDERLIKNAARNLVENAVRHGGRGVAVTVRVGPGQAFAVEDDGRDAPNAEEAGAIVHARKDGGLGVGLEIVRRIAALHDARFEIAPRSPRGVTARFSFPAREARPSLRS